MRFSSTWEDMAAPSAFVNSLTPPIITDPARFVKDFRGDLTDVSHTIPQSPPLASSDPAPNTT